MRAVLICPSERPGFRFLSAASPLVVTPLLGLGLVEYWLSYLAEAGTREVLILAHDRPDQVFRLVGNGSRWGVRIEVVPESRELTLAQASSAYAGDVKGPNGQECMFLLDHFPGLTQWPLFSTAEGWFAALMRWLPQATIPDRVGVHERNPGIWVGCRSRISRDAELRAPCWIGNHVLIGRNARVGPNAIVENGVVVDSGAEIARSYVGLETYVGVFSEVIDSVAYGSRLLSWRTGAAVDVPDPFMLCALRRPRAPRSVSLLSRAAEMYARNKGEIQMLWKQLLMNKEGRP